MMKTSGIVMFSNRGEYLQHISKERAVSLLYAQVATPVAATNEVWRSPSMEMIIPKAVMLKKNSTRYYAEKIGFNAEKMKKRDNYTCQYCGKSGVKLTVDHVIPKSRGGKNTWENCVAACEPCNYSKDNKTPDEAGMKLLKTPTVPDMPDTAALWNAILNEVDIN